MFRTRSWLLFPLAFALGCGGNTNTNTTGNSPGKLTPPAEQQAPATVALTLTAEELFGDYEKDGAAFKTKYAGKWVEVSGVVARPRIAARGNSDLLLVGKTLKPGEIRPGFLSVVPTKTEATKYDGLKALSKGQAVTLRGEVTEHGQLIKSEFVKVGPTTALPVTAAGLLAALADDAMKDKYKDKDVILRVEVRKANWNGTIAHLDVADPGVKDGPLLEVSINPFDDEHGKELAKTPVGSVVIVLGEAQTINDGRIWNFRILSAPPEGITLPEGKK